MALYPVLSTGRASERVLYYVLSTEMASERALYYISSTGGAPESALYNTLYTSVWGINRNKHWENLGVV